MREPEVEVDRLKSPILVQMSREIHLAEAQNRTASYGSILMHIHPIPRRSVLLYTAGEQVHAISQLIVRGSSIMAVGGPRRGTRLAEWAG